MSRRTGTIPFIFLALEIFAIWRNKFFQNAFLFSIKTGYYASSRMVFTIVTIFFIAVNP
jgi:hypothetical protein